MRAKIILILTCILSLISCENKPEKILIIGDSISIGYTPHVKELLGDRAIVTHNKGNAQHTGTGLEKIKEWIGDEDWDIIQFNWGLWDLAYRNLDVKNVGNRDKINGKVTFTPEQYKANVDSLVRVMKSLSDAELIFVTTSYVPEGEVGRFVKDGPIYNDAALEVMKKYNIPVTDIYEYSKELHARFATAYNNVHYTKAGYSQLAVKIVQGLARFDHGYLKQSPQPDS
ncbi:MAG: SGNH/GDSL hydrolase family protein [Bacteroidales bacterium]|nr:SGNH/GDSL hydrolase family protein [Bacteroidales bacterium]